MGQRYRRMKDQKSVPGLARNQGFATGRGLEPNFKKFYENV